MTQYLVTRGRDNVDRVHRPTCAKAKAQDGKLRNLSDLGGRKLATCCKPKPPETTAKKAAARTTPAKRASSTRKPASVTSIEKARAKKRGSRTAAAAPKVDPAPTPAWDPHPIRRADLALAEGKQLKAAKKAGKPAPATPNLDKVNEEYAAGIRAADRRRMAQEYEAQHGNAAGTRGPKATVTFTKDGKPVGKSQQRLSSMAYWYTKGIDAATPDRVSVARFREVLAGLGVTEPETTAWDVTLPNGITIGAKAGR